MSDIWSGIGVDIAKSEGEWLFRKGGDVHGPVPKKIIVEKLLSGELDSETPVAKEGGEFHPVGRIKIFVPHVQQAQKLAAQRSAGRVRRIVMAIVLLALAGGGVAGYFIYEAHERKKVEADQILRAKLEEQERLKKERESLGDLALVKLFDESDVVIKGGGSPVKKIGSKIRKPVPGEKKPPSGASDEGEKSVSSCERGPGDIVKVLMKNAALLTVCVNEEKKKDGGNLLPAKLGIEFVVRPDGKVVDFGISDRHYRTGMLKNCMTKVFQRVSYPAAGGSNCPIAIPITTGN
ncbi:MAG: hypothetical protein A2289_04050 [Deltaproteobacteria bacterium RIFOXYA12_FULL_58_15]|nr:MAG: hypothetical protein A2289_04050 [Deltaproteobacteria bacterium RIFOXYA12_FULL_58_15]OGR14587.1 MAG: hypothetical protein A2341_07460 [Deltaproteobacteria bacterium RIFOXYB12_FULL_58_9]